MSRSLHSFKDILEPRRNENSNFVWVSRELHSVVPYKQLTKPTPKHIKDEVLHTPKIQNLINKVSMFISFVWLS